MYINMRISNNNSLKAFLEKGHELISNNPTIAPVGEKFIIKDLDNVEEMSLAVKFMNAGFLRISNAPIKQLEAIEKYLNLNYSLKYEDEKLDPQTDEKIEETMKPKKKPKKSY